MNLNFYEMTEQEKQSCSEQYQLDEIASAQSPQNPDDAYMNEDLG